jgi:hypothetical protein
LSDAVETITVFAPFIERLPFPKLVFTKQIQTTLHKAVYRALLISIYTFGVWRGECLRTRSFALPSLRVIVGFVLVHVVLREMPQCPSTFVPEWRRVENRDVV